MKTKLSRRKLIALVVAVVVVLLVAAIASCGQGRGKPEADTAQVQDQGTPVLVQTAERGSLEDTVVLTGTAQAEHDSLVMPEIAGKIAAVYVRVGEHVRRGQPLARMDTDLAAASAAQAGAMVRASQARVDQTRVAVQLTDESTLSAIRSAENGVELARQQLLKARSARELTQQQVDNGVARAENGVQQAEAALRDIKAGSRRQEVTAAQARLEAAESALRMAESDYQRVKRLHEQGAVSAQMLDSARTQYEVAQSNVAQAREALSLAQEGARSEQVRLAELAVQQARQQLSLAEAAREQIRIADRDVNGAETGLQQAQEQLRMAQENRRQLEIQQQEARAAAAGVEQARAGQQFSSATLSKHTITAPFDGVIAERLVEAGAGVGTSTEVVRVVDLEPIKVETQVSELQVARLRAGMTAHVKVDGLPDLSFVGRLARLRPAANAGQRMYTAEVEVGNPHEMIRPGMFCRVSILLDTRHDTIVVPRDAIVENGRQRLIYAVQDGKVDMREVTLGAQNENLVEIVSGVEPGDQLIISGQSLLAQGQQVKPQQAKPGEGPIETVDGAEAETPAPVPTPAPAPTG